MRPLFTPPLLLRESLCGHSTELSLSLRLKVGKRVRKVGNGYFPTANQRVSGRAKKDMAPLAPFTQ